MQCISVAEFQKTPNYMNKEGENILIKKQTVTEKAKIYKHNNKEVAHDK